MIDFHTHILAGIDDGARDINTSLTLLKMLEEQGVDRVVLTPHYYGRNKDVSRFIASRDKAYDNLLAEYKGNISFVKGCECNISTCANDDFEDLASLCIQNTRYILTELCFEKSWDSLLWNKINALLDAGFIPVIAHAEIYPAVIKNPSLVYKLVELGCLIQVNCDSVVDENAFKLVKALVEHNLVHCLGSDTHSIHRRPPKYAQALAVLGQQLGGINDRLQKNMQAILEDKPIEYVQPSPVKRTLFGSYK